jgi:hypothetical protein
VVATGGQLDPRQGIHRHSVGIDALHVAEDGRGATARQPSAEAPAESSQVCARERAADDEDAGDHLY